MKEKNIEDEFDDILNTDFTHSINNTSDIEDSNVEFDFENNSKEEKTSNIPEYKRTKSELQENILDLQGDIKSMLDRLDTPIEDMLPSKDLLPGLDLGIEEHDYIKDLELIKIESKETLECLANLYLSEEMMKNKNIYKIIKDDANSLSKLNFSIETAQRALIGCMKQLDNGLNDPLMYQSVAMFQKEMRESIKMVYELQKKMKDFYKTLRDELKEAEINTGPEQIEDKLKLSDNNMTIIGDPKKLNDLFEQYKKDPTLLKKMMDDTNK